MATNRTRRSRGPGVNWNSKKMRLLKSFFALGWNDHFEQYVVENWKIYGKEYIRQNPGGFCNGVCWAEKHLGRPWEGKENEKSDYGKPENCNP